MTGHAFGYTFIRVEIERIKDQGLKSSNSGRPLEVIKMKHDMLVGITAGLIIGLTFTAHLTPLYPFILVVGVLLLAKVISTK